MLRSHVQRHHVHFFLFFEHEGFHVYGKIIYYRHVNPKEGLQRLPDKPNNDLPDLPPAADVETTAPLIQYDHCSLHR